MTETEFNNFIHFSDQKQYIENKMGKEEWITVYQSREYEKNGYLDDICFYSCLTSKENIEHHKIDPQWISCIGHGKPGIIEYNMPRGLTGKIKSKLFSQILLRLYTSNYLWTPEQLKKRNTKAFKVKNFLYCILSYIAKHKSYKIKEYKRFSKIGIEPLIHVRSFNNRPTYIEISEEFRHYFDLYEDRKKNILYTFDKSGNPIEVIKIFNNSPENRKVKIKKEYINEFLYVKKMWLCVQFDNRRWISKTLEKTISEEFCSKTGDYIYSLNSENIDHEDKKSFIKFIGRKLIPYKNIDFLHYESEKKYEDFSFIDKDGNEKSFTCESDKLANFYGKNAEAPHYLTPVSFNKEVLKKYYDNSNQYSVKDSHLCCNGFWSVEIDVQDNYVVVFLGDLSKLPYEEQKYWRSYNITRTTKISKVNWERSFECKFTETVRPDFLFKKKYTKFNEEWNKKYDWYFFKPLLDTDEYCFDSLRLPLNENQNEFDSQIMYLIKVFIESINTEQIKKNFPANYEKNSRTIDVLSQLLSLKNVESDQVIEFLRNLQKLRSKGSAHRKEQDYDKVLDYFKQLNEDQNSDNKMQIFSKILVKCIWTMRLLGNHFLKNEKREKSLCLYNGK